MKAKLSLAPVVVVAFAALVAFSGQAAAKTTARYDFEKDLNPWLGMSDKGSSGFSFTRVTGDNGCIDVKGSSFASLKMSPADGTNATWMMSAHQVMVPGNERISLQLDARDAGNCATCVPLVYVGAAKPQSVDSFKRLLPSGGDGPNAIGWTQYAYQSDTFINDMVYVALGWKYGPPPLPPSPGIGAALRNDYLYDTIPVERPVDSSSYGFDCVSLDIYPAP